MLRAGRLAVFAALIVSSAISLESLNNNADSIDAQEPEGPRGHHLEATSNYFVMTPSRSGSDRKTARNRPSLPLRLQSWKLTSSDARPSSLSGRASYIGGSGRDTHCLSGQSSSWYEPGSQNPTSAG